MNAADIVEAAIAIADREGFDAVSIRRVANELGNGPMSLYTHIAGKDELVSLMVDELFGQALAPAPAGEWRADLSAQARQFRETIVAHPWMIDAFGQRPRLRRNSARRAILLAQCLEGLGLADDEVWRIVGVVDDYVFGHTLRGGSAERRDGGLEAVLTAEDLEAHPELRALGRARRARRSSSDFEAGLQIVLDGIAVRLAERTANAP